MTFNFSSPKYILSLILMFMLPEIAFCNPKNTLSPKQQSIELLIEQKKYDKACRETVNFLIEFETIYQDKAIEYARQKLYDFITLCITHTPETINWTNPDYNISCLSRVIIDCLFPICPLQAYNFAKELFTLVHDKEGWQDTIEYTIEEIGYQFPSNEVYQHINSLIDQFLSISPMLSPEKFLERINSKFKIIHNLLAINNFKHHPFDQCLISLGKKYVDHFFKTEEPLIKQFVADHYSSIKKFIDKNEPDANIFLSNDKDTFVTTIMNMVTGVVASVNLSIALLMKKNDAIQQLKETYNTLVKQGYSTTATSLKEYVVNQPKTEEDDCQFYQTHFIINPRHLAADNLIIIPNWCKQAFAN